MLGVVVGGHKLVAKIGEGGMGVVYAAEDTVLGRRTAVKMLRPAMSRNHKIVQRFFNEARAAARLRHPGIVEIHSFGYHDDGSAFLVMEYLEGESLEARLDRRGKLGVDEALRITRQVCSALDAAHAHDIVHRDLKPDNIFLITDPDIDGGERIKLLDFGIAKLAPGTAGSLMTQTGQVMGTPAYMAPEQCRGAAGVDHRADLYAVGCVLFRMLCTQVPFPGELSGDVIAAQIRDRPPRPRDLDPTISPAIEAVILRLLEKDPGRRYESAKEVRRALEPRPEPYRHPTPTPIPLSSTLPGTGGGARRSAEIAARGGATRPSASQPIPAARAAPTEPRAVGAAAAPPVSTAAAPPGAPEIKSSPTTLGESTGERSVRAGRRRGRAMWWIAGAVVALLAGGGTGLALWIDRPSAGDGPSIDAYAIGRDLERGRTGPIDEASALAHYQHACVDGDARGCAAWGRMLAEGRPDKTDRQTAAELLRIACEGGEARGCTGLGQLAFRIWRPRLFVDRRALFERACDAGDPHGCIELANVLRVGLERHRDTSRAEQLEARAATLLEPMCELDPRECELLASVVSPKDPSRALALRENACDRGRGQACLAAAGQYRRGSGIPASSERADGFEADGELRLTDACDGGDLDACVALALQVSRSDKARAVDLAERVCAAGGGARCANVSSVDPERFTARACELGFRDGCAQQWRHFQSVTNGAEASNAALARWVALSERACAVGDAGACSAIAQRLAAKPFEDIDRAVTFRDRTIALVTPACEAGDAWSCFVGASILQSRQELADYAQAAELAERGCAIDEANGIATCVILGGLYESGKGVKRDPIRASELFGKACDRELGRGCHRLAAMFHSGIGIPRDLARAADRYDRGCELNYPSSCVELSKLYEAGAGVPRDLVKARELASRTCRRYGGGLGCAEACRLGDKGACK